MNKNWKTAPWIIRLILIYWLLPGAILLIAFCYMLVMFSQIEINEIWRIPLGVLEAKYKLMPISTSIDISFTIVSIFAAYYGWRLLRGSGIARNILEIIAWLMLSYSAILMLFPEIEYFEMPTPPTGTIDIPLEWTVLGWFFVLLELVVLIALRKKIVKDYANIF